MTKRDQKVQEALKWSDDYSVITKDYDGMQLKVLAIEVRRLEEELRLERERANARPKKLA